MKQGTTIMTRGIIYLMGIAVLAVCGILLPELAREEAAANPGVGPAYPFLIGAWVLSIPIFVALYQALRILGYIDGNNAFSNRSVKALKNIKICAIVFSVMIIIAATSVIIIGKSIDPTEDLAPVASIGFIITFVSVVVATFVAVLQRLLQDAIHMKSENDLTV